MQKLTPENRLETSVLRRFRLLLPAAVVVATAWAGFSQPASATVIVSTIDFSFGTGTGAGTSLTATFDDGGSAGSVILTINVSNLAVGAKVQEFYFNYVGDSANLAFGPYGGTADIPATITNTIDCCKAAGSGFFDVSFQWNSGTEFLQTDTFAVQMIFGGLLATDFISASFDDKKGPFCTAAHIGDAGLNSAGNPDSDHLGGQCREDPGFEVPEPATLLLFGIGLLGLGAVARRRNFAA